MKKIKYAGTTYEEYLKREVQKGNLIDIEFTFWIRQNRRYKRIMDVKRLKLIPYYS